MRQEKDRDTPTMLVIFLQFSIILLSIAIYPLQLYRSYNRYVGVDSAQAVVSDWLFPLLITQSVLWLVYAVQSSEWFILFNSMANVLFQCCILFCIRMTKPTVLAVAVPVPVDLHGLPGGLAPPDPEPSSRCINNCHAFYPKRHLEYHQLATHEPWHRHEISNHHAYHRWIGHPGGQTYQ